MDKKDIEACATEWSQITLGLLKNSMTPEASIPHLIELRARLYNAVAVHLKDDNDPSKLIKRFNNVINRWEELARVSCPRIEAFDADTGMATLTRT